MPSIRRERVLSDLRQLAKFGQYKTGVHRPTFSADDMAARQWLVDQLSSAGLSTSIDGIGNVYGCHEPGKRLVLAGSHIESQNYAGWLDGALGVIYALEALRAIKEDKAFSHAGVDVVGFADEEGHFIQFLGSRSFVNALSDAEIDRSRNQTTGEGLRKALSKAGLAGKTRVHLDPSRYEAYFEGHIEQGDFLDNEGLQIGIVTAIVAIWQYKICVVGEQNHAGTTSMARRRDAGASLIRLLTTIEERFKNVAGPRTVWTTGKVEFSPGASHIIPGRAEALLQFRDTELPTLIRLEQELMGAVSHANQSERCEIEITRTNASEPCLMNEKLQGLLSAAARNRAPEAFVKLPSGAGHDAQWLAPLLPTAMLFVPSIGGISHHWAENTSENDIVLGAQVFTDAIAALLAFRG